MKKILLTLAMSFGALIHADADISIPSEKCLFVKAKVPSRGIVSSNMDRIDRIASYMDDVTMHKCSWGPKLYIGKYKGEEFFAASAPVGSGSGLVFTELYAQGAEYIVRYGSDDLGVPTEREYDLIKVIDETDNLYGFNHASGVPIEEWGKSIFASEELIKVLEEEASVRNCEIEKRVCHHLENYHALRNPEMFPRRKAILEGQVTALKRSDKKESIDMESAVLFRVAKDSGKHAAAVLQTVRKNNPKLGPYEGANRVHALNAEKNVFVDFVFSALSRLPNRSA